MFHNDILSKCLIVLSTAALTSMQAQAFHQAGEVNVKANISFVPQSSVQDDVSYRTYSYTKEGTTKEKHSRKRGGMFQSDAVIDIDLAVDYFMASNIALEVSTSFPYRNSENKGNSNITYSGYWNNPNRYFVNYNKYNLEFAGKFYLQNESALAPYIGFGANYVRFSSLKTRYTYDYFSYDKDSIGTLFKVGFDYNLNDTSFFNFEIKQPRSKFKFNYSDNGNYDYTADGYDNADGDNAKGTYKTTIFGKTNMKPFVISIGAGLKF